MLLRDRKLWLPSWLDAPAASLGPVLGAGGKPLIVPSGEATKPAIAEDPCGCCGDLCTCCQETSSTKLVTLSNLVCDFCTTDFNQTYAAEWLSPCYWRSTYTGIFCGEGFDTISLNVVYRVACNGGGTGIPLVVAAISAGFPTSGVSLFNCQYSEAFPGGLTACPDITGLAYNPSIGYSICDETGSILSTA